MHFPAVLLLQALFHAPSSLGCRCVPQNRREGAHTREGAVVRMSHDFVNPLRMQVYLITRVQLTRVRQILRHAKIRNGPDVLD
jgi:hypothetical protein